MDMTFYQTRFGDMIYARWLSGNVETRVNAGAWATAFALTNEAALALQERPDGQLVITYKDVDGALVQKTSRDRTTWT